LEVVHRSSAAGAALDIRPTSKPETST
jgi:hypothetical protein